MSELALPGCPSGLIGVVWAVVCDGRRPLLVFVRMCDELGGFSVDFVLNYCRDCVLLRHDLCCLHLCHRRRGKAYRPRTLQAPGPRRRTVVVEVAGMPLVRDRCCDYYYMYTLPLSWREVCARRAQLLDRGRGGDSPCEIRWLFGLGLNWTRHYEV